MKKFVKFLAALAVVGLVVIGLIIFLPVSRTAPQTNVAGDYTTTNGHGEYAMRMGDCMACHTADGGKPFAGGRPIESPFGTIWSTNITPDPEHGIGNYSLDDFRASLYDGIEPDGTRLYPAMPYENYRKLSEEDIRAMYDYFMHDVEPVNEAPPKPTLDSRSISAGVFAFGTGWRLAMQVTKICMMILYLIAELIWSILWVTALPVTAHAARFLPKLVKMPKTTAILLVVSLLAGRHRACMARNPPPQNGAMTILRPIYGPVVTAIRPLRAR